MKRLILIDANAIIHKAFYALPTLTNRKGEYINAIYGFSSILLKVLNELNPDYITAAFDLAAPTFRHIEYKEYKAKRVKKPDELINQIPKTKEILKGLNISVLEKKGFEADDVIGTISKKFNKKDLEILILTGDLDTLQLVDKKIKVYSLKKGMTDTIVYGEKEVFERYELKPEQLIDYKGLRGDPSDNIPGVSGVGEKTACALLKEFTTIENLYKNIEKMSVKEVEKHPFLTSKLINRLKQDKKIAFFSKKLATIREDVPIKIDLRDLDWKKGYDVKKAEQAFNQFYFKSLINRLPGKEPEIELKQQNLL
jgi:DNA polymerase-1